MIRRPPLAALLGLALLASPPAVAQEAPPPAPPAAPAAATAEVGLHATLDEAVAAARASGRPLLVFATAGWSRHTTKLMAAVADDPLLRARLARAHAVRLEDDEAGRAFRDRHGVRELPTALILSPDGDEFGRIAGALPAPEWAARFDAILARTPKR